MPHTNEGSTQRLPLFSDAFVAQMGESLANQIVDQICRGLMEGPTPQQRPTSLCLEIIVFELDEDLLRELVQCVFTQFNPVQLAQEIILTFNHVQRIFQGQSQIHPTSQTGSEHPATTPETSAGSTDPSPPLSYPNPVSSPTQPTTSTIPSPTPAGSTEGVSLPLPICKFDLIRMILEQVYSLQNRLLGSCHLRERIFEEILLYPVQLSPELLGNIEAVTNHAVIQNFRQGLINQYDNFALKNCNKVSCINSDLEFIAEQIKQLTINFPAGELGIIEIADAAGGVAEAFHSEEHDFDEIFDAVDAVAEVIEDLADFYKVKLNQLERLLDLAISGCPVPIEARATLPTIPEITPAPAIFPIIGLTPFAQTPIPSITPITPITTIIP